MMHLRVRRLPARTGRLTARMPVQPAPAPDAPLVERYAHMAHTFERRPVDRVLRALDVVLAGTLLVAAAPVVAVAAVLVRLSGRTVLYRGRRVGRAGAVFTMYKLRTLREDAEVRLTSYLGPELTQLTVQEQTRVGRVLRATKVDELPQLYNVVCGDMSLVGPRPIRPGVLRGALPGHPGLLAAARGPAGPHGARAAADVARDVVGREARP